MKLVVADASAVVEYLFGTPQGIRLRSAFESPDHDLHVPALCDVEMAAVLRRALLEERLADRRAREALIDYFDLPLTRHGHVELLPRILALRANFTAYDATYVALAEHLDATLVTADEPLARAVAAHARIPLHELPG